MKILRKSENIDKIKKIKVFYKIWRKIL